MGIKSLVGVFVLTSFCCKQVNEHEKIQNNVDLSQVIYLNDTLLKYTDEWKKDSLGCLKLRTKRKAEKIIEMLTRDRIDEKKLYQNLGKPNEIKKTPDGGYVLTYYFDSVCRNGKLVNGSDKCYANIYMLFDVYKSVDYIYE